MLLTHRCSILCIVQYTIQLCPFMEKRIHLSMQLAKNLKGPLVLQRGILF